MDRRFIILAQTKPIPPDPVLPATPLAPVPPPTQVQKGTGGGNALFAVYSGLSDTIPPLRNYTQMDLPTLTTFLGQLVPSGPDQAELSLLAQRAQQDTPVGSSDHIRLTTLNASKDGGDPGLVQIVRLR